ncbi:MAG TPA: alpha/beta fold hydrolase [Candidatus Deferrimicrobium sp.]|nr:alpha/beta fold hydrolase [Candidatus Deferrimicrobium sp.]
MNGEVRTSNYQCQTHCYLSVGDQTWTDYKLELDMRGDAGQDKVFSFRGYGINFRSAPNNDVHLVGTGEDLVQSFTNYNGTTYHFKVECVGPRIKVSINSSLVFDYIDNSSPSLSGGIKLELYSGGACAADVSFDNVVVTRMYDKPVVLVHGWTGSAGSWTQFKQWLENDGFMYVWAVSINPCGPAGEKDFDKNAEILSNYIEAQLNALSTQLGRNIREIDIVAHSMGGVVARRYTSPGSISNSWSMINRNRTVRHLVMLGTPNSGSNLASVTLAWLFKAGKVGGPLGDAYTYFKAKCTGPAKSEFSTPKMALFNARYEDNFTSDYRVVAGTFYSNCLGDQMKSGAGFFEGCPNDGVVGIVSVFRAIPYWPLRSNRPVVKRFAGESRSLKHGDLVRNEALAHAVAGTLATSYDPGKLLPPVTPYFAKDAFDDSTFAPICGSSAVVVSGGTPAVDSVSVPNTTGVTFGANGYGIPVKLSVQSPSGMTYDSVSSLPDSSIIYSADSNGVTLFVSTPQAGLWRLQVSADSVPDPLWPVLLTWNWYDEVLLFASVVPEICLPYDSLRLFAKLSNLDVPVTGADVEATLIPESTALELHPILNDEGNYPDSVAYDGVYSAILPPFVNDSEVVAIVINANGTTSGGQVFSKQAYLGAVITSEFCCIGTTGNVDGLIGPAGEIDVTDLTYLVGYLFQSGQAPPCDDEGNVDGITGPAGAIDVSDLTYLVAFLFSGGAAPPAC